MTSLIHVNWTAVCVCVCALTHMHTSFNSVIKSISCLYIWIQHPIMNREAHRNSHVFHFTRHNQDLESSSNLSEIGSKGTWSLHYTKPYCEDPDYKTIINYGGRLGENAQCNLNIRIYRTFENVHSNGSLVGGSLETQSWRCPLTSNYVHHNMAPQIKNYCV